MCLCHSETCALWMGSQLQVPPGPERTPSSFVDSPLTASLSWLALGSPADDKPWPGPGLMARRVCSALICSVRCISGPWTECTAWIMHRYKVSWQRLLSVGPWSSPQGNTLPEQILIRLSQCRSPLGREWWCLIYGCNVFQTCWDSSYSKCSTSKCFTFLLLRVLLLPVAEGSCHLPASAAIFWQLITITGECSRPMASPFVTHFDCQLIAAVETCQIPLFFCNGKQYSSILPVSVGVIQSP